MRPSSRTQRNIHNKGIIVDGEDRTGQQRELVRAMACCEIASGLIIHDKDIAGYYEPSSSRLGKRANAFLRTIHPS